MIKLGTNNIGKIYFGNNSIGKAYLGSNLVFQKGGSPTPPGPQPQPILPAGFTELAYVATNGAAWIDTGIAGATDLEITVVFYVGTYSQYSPIYGNYIDESHKCNRAILNTSSSLYVAGGDNSATSVSDFSLGASHKLTVNSTTVSLNGNSTNISANSQTENTNSIHLCNNGTNNSASNIGLRIYSFEVKKDGTTVLNLVPAMRESDDAVGFYDLVSDSFMKSLTGTEFTAGPANNYAPVEYIATDGAAYINTGIVGVDPRSAEIKCVAKQKGDRILASSTGSENASNYVLLFISSGAAAGLAHYHFYSNGFPSVQDAITNGTPFVARVAIRKGSQSMSVKKEGESSYTTYSITDNNTTNSTRTLYLFGSNTGGTPLVAASGTRVYYCKIYSDNTFGGLVFDGVPCYYNGEYGLWDKVSGTFKGNAAASGAFSRHSNS